jgi:hypothetical protein
VPKEDFQPLPLVTKYIQSPGLEFGTLQACMFSNDRPEIPRNVRQGAKIAHNYIDLIDLIVLDMRNMQGSPNPRRHTHFRSPQVSETTPFDNRANLGFLI